jgi:hypothetical protein
MGQKSDCRPAVAEILKFLKRLFQDYTRTARQRAWDSILSKKTEKEIEKIINYPKTPLISPERFATTRTSKNIFSTKARK